MRKVLTALLTAGCFAAGSALSAGTAHAQGDAWNGGWHVGGDYYYPTYSSYEAAPIYDYGAAPAYSAAAYSYGAAPLYDYGSAPAYGPAGYGYGAAPLYDYGAAPSYGAAVVGAQIQPIRTVEIVRTVYLPARSAAARRIATRRTAVHDVARSRPQQNDTASNVAAPASRNGAYANRGAGPAYSLYDTAAAATAQPVAARADAGPAYRYVYQRDRILVIDPSTNAVVQTLHR